MNTDYNPNSDNCQSQWNSSQQYSEQQNGGQQYNNGQQYNSGQQYNNRQYYQQGGNYDPYQQGYRDGYRAGFDQACRPPYRSAKNRTTFGILAILLGSLGIQYFYVDKIAGGIFTILLTLVTCGLWGVISVIQGILVLSSMNDWEFDEKFVFSRTLFPIF